MESVRPPRSLHVDLEQIAYFVQRRSVATGEWRNETPPIIGRTNAYRQLREMKATAEANGTKTEYRAVTKSEAEKYKEAWKDALHFAREGEPRPRWRVG